MSLKKRFPGSSYAESEGLGRDTVNFRVQPSDSSEPQNIFQDTYISNVNYKTDQAFDFETYKTKIVKGLEIFGEDITNLKSNMNHLYGLVDYHLFRDFYDITNELVAITQMKLEGVISKSSTEVRNHNDEDISGEVLQKVGATKARRTIQENLARYKEDIELFLSEDKQYRRTGFAVSDLGILLEKLFKLYDVFDNQSSLLNYLKIEDSNLYESLLLNKPEAAFAELLELNLPILLERLSPDKLYRTPAAVTKERLVFRVEEIIAAHPQKFTLPSISSFIKTQLVREKFNLKNNIIALFQKALPDGLKLSEEVDRSKKEIVEELNALRDGAAYLDGHHKSYIKIISGIYHSDFITNLSFNTVNVDILIDIEKLFFIIDDITTRLGALMQKVKSFRILEEKAVEQAVKNAVDKILEDIRKTRREKGQLQPHIEEIFGEIVELIEKEKGNRKDYEAEKVRIQEERRKIEETKEVRQPQPYVSTTYTNDRPEYLGSGSKPAAAATLNTQDLINKYQPTATVEKSATKDIVNKYQPKEEAQPAARSWDKPADRRELSEPKPVEKLPEKLPEKPAVVESKGIKTTAFEPISEPLQLPKTGGSTSKKDSFQQDNYREESFKPSSAYETFEEKKTSAAAPVKKEEKSASKPIPNSYDIAKEVDDIYSKLNEDDNKPVQKDSKSSFDEDEDDFYKPSSFTKKPEPKAVQKLNPLEQNKPKELPPVTKKEEIKLPPAKQKDSGFWGEEIDDLDDFDDKPKSQSQTSKNELPPAKFEPKSQLPPLTKGTLEPLGGPKTGKLEPLAALKPSGLGKLESLTKPKDEFEEIEIEDTAAQRKPAQPSGLDKLYSKLESDDIKKDDKKKEAEEAKLDDEIEEDYDYDFDSDTEKGSPEKKKDSPAKKDSPVKNKEPIKEIKKEEPEPVVQKPKQEAPAAAAQAANVKSLITKDSLDLINEHIEQEADVLNQPIDPEGLNDLNVMVSLFQEFFSQMKLFIFDYPETQAILEQVKDVKRFKKSSVSSDIIENIAEEMRNYYLEMLPTESQVSESSRIFVPFAAPDINLPILLEIDLENQSFTYFYLADVPSDRDSENFTKEFTNLLKDIFNSIFENNSTKVDSCSTYRVGLSEEAQETIGQFEGAVYLRIMPIIFYLVYETTKISKEETILAIDSVMLSRFFCTLTSLNFVGKFLGSENWMQYSAHYLSIVEQLEDQQTKIKYLQYDESSTSRATVKKEVQKELQKFHGDLKKGVVEVYSAIDILQTEFKSAYYVFMTSEVGETTTKQYKAVLFVPTSNDPECDKEIEEIVNGLDKTGNTEVVIWKDYSRHSLNYNYPAVTLGAWLLLIKQNQFSPEEAMTLIIYNMNGYHLPMEGQEGEEGEEGTEDQRGMEYGEDDLNEEDFDELPIDDIDDDN